MLPKSPWKNFKTIFETLSALGACRVTFIGGMVYKKSMIFEVFHNILASFFIFLHGTFYNCKIVSRCCDKHQNFDYESSSDSENEAQSPHFGHFLTILSIFRLVCLGKSLQPMTLIFYKNSIYCIWFYM